MSELAYMRNYLSERQLRLRNEAIQAFGAKCARCGSVDGPFEFDHIDPADKEIEIGSIWRYGAEKREKELAKCWLLCITCHKIKTCADNGWEYSKSAHGLPGSHRYCSCADCRSAWQAYKNNRKPPRSELPDRCLTPIHHGTRAGYLKEIRRKLPPCESCRQANSDYTLTLLRRTRFLPS